MSKQIHTQVFLRDDIIAILSSLTLTAQQAGGESSDFARGFATAISATALALGVQPAEVQTALNWSQRNDH